MNIMEFLPPGCILPDMANTTKRGVLEELAAVLVPGPEGLDIHQVVEVLMDRERLGSTGIGDHVAFPHGKLARLTKVKLAFGRSFHGVDFDSMDGKPSHLFFLLLAPANSAGLHLKVLAKISRMLMNQVFRDELMKAAPEDLYPLLTAKDAEL